MSSRGVIELVDLETGATLVTLKGHAGVVWPMNPSSDDRRLATGSADETIRVWDLGTRGEVAALAVGDGYYADSGLDTHGTLGAALIYPGESAGLFSWISSEMTGPATGEVIIFDTATGEVSTVIARVAGKVARISPDGSRLAVQTTSPTGDLSTVAIFNVGTGALEVELEGICDWTDTASTLGEEFVEFTGSCTFDSFPFATDVTDIAWSPDGSLLAATGGWSRRWIVWNATTGEQVHVGAPGEWAEFPLSAVQFSPTGEVIAVSNKTGTAIYDTAGWERVAFIQHTGSPSWVLRFTPDGQSLVSAQAHTGDVRVFDASNWQAEARHLPAGAGQIRDMALSSDGSLVAVSSNDGLIHVLSLESGLPIEVLTIGDVDVTNVEFIDGDQKLLVTSSQGPVQILTLDWDELIAVGRSRVVRTFSEDECRIYRIEPCPTLEMIRNR
jgi:WD40 repeat protein